MASMQRMEPTQAVLANKNGESERAFIAYLHCESGKVRCDGGIPKCSNCIARNASCGYAPARKTSGLGKSKIYIESLEKKLENMERLLQTSCGSDSGMPGANAEGESSPAISSSILKSDKIFSPVGANNATSSQPTNSVDSSQTRMSARNRFPPISVEQPFADVNEKHSQEFRKSIKEAIFAPGFVPLIRPAMSRHLIANSFGEIMAEYPLFDVSKFMELLNAQYLTRPSGPGDNCTRWARVNAVLALAIRAKAAPSAGKGLSDVINAFYRNASAVLPELSLQDPSLLSIQALLAMAMFCCDARWDRCVAHSRLLKLRS